MRFTKKYKLLLLMAVVTSLFTVSAQNQNLTNINKLRTAEYFINEFYVDSIDEGKLVEDAIRGMISELDPHSQYTNAAETKELQEPLEGSFVGVGIQFTMQKDTLYIVQTIVGGPAEKVGLVAGDRIIEVNDTIIAGVQMTNTDIMKRLRGVKGTAANVKVKRAGVKDVIDFKIIRDKIPLYSIDAAYMLDDNIGYIKISRFANDTYSEFMESVKKLKKAGMKQLIIDLTNNGGGYMGTAISISNEFLNRGENIVYTQGNKSPRYDANANGRGALKDIKLAIMVNEYSASASEIVSGAIQDWDRGVIVGRRTFGKGLVQRPYIFDDGSMLRLTTARYYTPSGRSIQKPYEKGGKDDYNKDIYERMNHGELTSADSAQVMADSLAYHTLKLGRKIYGGGGITPDIFVPIDTTEYSDYYRNLFAKSILNQYSISYVDKNRDALKATYPTVDDFIANFTVTDDIIAEVVTMATETEIEPNEEELTKSINRVKSSLKALIASDIYTNEAFYQVLNLDSDIVKAAITALKEK
ncbi:MAG: S41 family peptidase [Bacteroidales bacterium]